MEETVNVQTVVQYWEAASRFDIFINGGVSDRGLIKD